MTTKAPQHGAERPAPAQPHDPTIIVAPAGTLFERYFERFGPYGFGVLSLVIIWYAIVSPELKANRAKTEEIQRIAEVMRTTAELVNQAVVRLERLENRLEKPR